MALAESQNVNITMETYSRRDQIIEVVNRLFIYTDDQEWKKLQAEVFTETVDFDMTSLGGEASQKTAKSICVDWEAGFKDLDAVNHLAGNFLVDVNEDEATVFCYATATHFKEAATQGKTRAFVGSYDLHLIQTEEGWRIDRFKYNLKYAEGNMELH